eukprot:207246-Pyramimonas_sp.AAC.1
MESQSYRRRPRQRHLQVVQSRYQSDQEANPFSKPEHVKFGRGLWTARSNNNPALEARSSYDMA